MLSITPSIALDDREIELTAIRAQGSGGQNVNKVASAVHLRFDILGSSLPQRLKHRLLLLKDSRLTADGCIIIKAQQYRSQEQNREDALQRLAQIIRTATIERKKRKPTRPSRAAREKRMDSKSRRGQLKSTRRKVQ